MGRAARPFAAAVLAALLLLSAGCERQHLVDPPHNSPRDPATPGAPAAPPQPGAVTADGIGASFVSLRWSVSDSSRVSSYKVYRQSGSDPTYALAGTSSIQHAVVTGLQTGSAYAFRITAVNTVGLEGPRSEAVVARPSIINILLNANAEVTSNPALTVQATASGFNQIRLNLRIDSLATTDYQTLPASGAISFSLTGGDGVKTVFAQFRDTGTGNESEVVSDDIRLDRFAQITSFTHSPDPDSTWIASQVMHFTLTSGETDGSATVDIGTAKTGIRLFDDGTNGDATAGNGVYEADYTVEASFDANNVAVIGRFTDRAGNSATPSVAPGLVSIKNPPPAVTLTSATPQGGGKVQLQWTQSGATDFFSYRVRHATVSPVSPNGTLDTTITVRTGTTATVGGLTPGTLRFAIEVVDNAGNFTASNELPATVTGPAAAPASGFSPGRATLPPRR